MKRITTFSNFENRIDFDFNRRNTPQLMTLQDFKFYDETWPQYEHGETLRTRVEDILNVFYEEIIVNHPEALTEKDKERLMKYANSKGIPYQCCYSYVCRCETEYADTRTTGIRITNLKPRIASLSENYSHDVNIVTYDIARDGMILEKQQLSFYLNTPYDFQQPQINWKKFSVADTTQEYIYSRECLEYVKPKVYTRH